MILLKLEKILIKSWRMILMERNNGHLTLNEFMKFVGNRISRSNLYMYKTMHRDIVKKWKTPDNWLESDVKTIYKYSNNSNTYWFNWGLCKGKKLPIDFIKSVNICKCKEILKVYLNDFDELEKVASKLRSKYKGSSAMGVFSKVMRMCLFLGVNYAKSITYKNLTQAFVEKILDAQELYLMEELLRDLGAISIPPVRTKKWKDTIQKEKDLKSKVCWSKEMESTVKNFLYDMERSRICKKERIAKEGHLNLFGSWYINTFGVIAINDFKYISHDVWVKYISSIIKTKELSDKTKEAKLTTIIQFFDWIKVKKDNIISKKFMYSRDDFKILDGSINNDNYAFEKRLYGEKILRYLLNDFRADCIREEFCKEAIIIYANSGMRYSELRDMEYKSIFFSKDEGMYKMIIKYEDKLGQVNRPVYFTSEGYKAVKRVEELRRRYSNLEERYNKRAKKSFIHLFEYEGLNVLEEKYLCEFLMRVKYRLNLVDENGRCVKGNIHAFRHFFGMTVFRLSNYNISVVRYLLGHRSYKMSSRYLEEENSLLFSKIREEKEQKRITGKGIDTLYDFIYGRISTPIPTNIERYLSSDSCLIDILNSKEIKRIDIGFCLNPCKNANKCYKCRFFLVTENEKNQLISYLCDLIGILTYKIQKSNKSVDQAINIPSIAEDLDDVIILIEELKNLGVKDDELSSILDNGKR
jgi:integrase